MMDVSSLLRLSVLPSSFQTLRPLPSGSCRMVLTRFVPLAALLRRSTDSHLAWQDYDLEYDDDDEQGSDEEDDVDAENMYYKAKGALLDLLTLVQIF